MAAPQSFESWQLRCVCVEGGLFFADCDRTRSSINAGQGRPLDAPVPVPGRDAVSVYSGQAWPLKMVLSSQG